MKAHTPGPWKVFYAKNGSMLGIGQDTGQGVTDAHGGLWGDGGEKQANARLIAAAPELLAALSTIQRICADIPAIERNPRFAEARRAALAAIAKAEGRS